MNLNVNQVLSCLQGVRQTKQNQWIALCPCHDDHNPSLSITLKEGKLLVKCFAGCDQNTLWNKILKLAGVEKRYNVHRNGRNGHRNASQQIPRCKNVDKTSLATGDTKPSSEAEAQESTSQQETEPPRGVTLHQIAEAKGLPTNFLKELGVSQWYDQEGAPRLRIPYYDEDGNEMSCRLRWNLSGDRFRWRKGSKKSLYGLWRLKEAKDAGFVLLVEGETDCWTLWHCGIPAVGIPGKDSWMKEWARHLQGLRTYLWVEPDATELPLKVGQDLPDVLVVWAQQFKDPSEAYLALAQERFVEWLRTELQKAEPVQDVLQRASEAELQRLYEACREVREHPDPLELIKQEISRLYAGDPTPAYAAYLAATTRLLPAGDGNMPAHLLLVGSPSCGKSHALKVVQRLLPDEAFVRFDATSQRALIYTDRSFKHRVLFIAEADSLPTSDRGEDNPAASAVRALLQDGAVEYAVVVTRQNSAPTVEVVRKEGPTTLITTATRPFGEQLGSRLFTFPVADDEQQISAVVQAICRFQNEKPQAPKQSLVAYQAYLQRLAPIHVTIPFAEAIGCCIVRNSTGPRILRDLQRLLALVKVVAILRGRSEATLEDYAEVASVAEAMYQASSLGVTERVRTVVHAVHQLRSESAENELVNLTRVAEYTGLHPQQVKRTVNQAINKGWLVNRSHGKSYDLGIGEPLPEEVRLPTADEVRREWLGDHPTSPTGTKDDGSTSHHGRSPTFTGFHTVSRVSREPDGLLLHSPLSQNVDAAEGERGGVHIPRESVKSVKQRECDVKPREYDVNPASGSIDEGVPQSPSVDSKTKSFLHAPSRDGMLDPLSKWLLQHFRGRVLTGAAVMAECLDYWRDEWSEDGSGSLYGVDDIRAAMCELLSAGLVRRVEVDGTTCYEFPAG